MARTLKTLSDTGDFILVQAPEPYVQQYGILRVMNAQSSVLTKEELRKRLTRDCTVLS